MKSRVRGVVRLHLQNDQRSVEGLLTGIVEGHYRLVNSRILLDSNAEHDVKVDGEAFWPTSRVLYVQRIG